MDNGTPWYNDDDEQINKNKINKWEFPVFPSISQWSVEEDENNEQSC